MAIVLVSSPYENSGKTTSIIGLGQRLRRQGKAVSYLRMDGPGAAADAAFVIATLRLGDRPSEAIVAPGSFRERFSAAATADAVTFLEVDNVRSLDESMMRSLTESGSTSLIVTRYRADDLTSAILDHAKLLPNLPTAVIVNAVPEKGRRQVDQRITPTLATSGLPVVGVIPQDRVLVGLSVGDLATYLGAEVLCASESLDEPVEGVMICAMSDEGAADYFRRMARKAVVAGGDRPDIHMPALATDTSCIVLTEGFDPDPTVFKTAQEQSVPLLKVTPGTMETLNNISDALTRARFHQNYKVARAVALFGSHVNEPALCRILDVAGREVAS